MLHTAPAASLFQYVIHGVWVSAFAGTTVAAVTDTRPHPRHDGGAQQDDGNGRAFDIDARRGGSAALRR
jgi:hypothetical protein